MERCRFTRIGYRARIGNGAVLAFVLTALPLLTIAGCALPADEQPVQFEVDIVTGELLEGLLLEGEGPIPARLIYQSRNVLSIEEDRTVYDEIVHELDRLVELADRLDEAVVDETERTGRLAPVQ